MNVYYIDVDDQNDLQTNISKENNLRISIPVQYMHDNLTSSKSLLYDLNQLISYLQSSYSLQYINKIFNYTFDKCICKSCTFQVSKNIEICPICDSNVSVGDYLDNDTIITTNTKDLILATCSILIDIVESNHQYAYALVRPPGHHSCADAHGGFCIFNNVILMAN